MNAQPKWAPRKQSWQEELRASAAADARRPKLPAEYRFALVREVQGAKPLVFPSLEELARGILRRRAGRSLVAENRFKHVWGEVSARPGVRLTLRDADRWSYETLGWAWLDGLGREVLKDALFAIEPNHIAPGELVLASRSDLGGGRA